MENNEYIDSILRIINNELPIIYKYNKHLYQIILSAIELIMDKSYDNLKNNIEISEEVKKEVDEIISEINLQE